ncbi:MAG: hypothetical protein A2Y10_13365 [Planctomycetes bacterium GWF2_41_51]|nr:MAG: hypothetical protein A2Y10_13365 [Planctomycetes bacterium GWF2_41_51]HBG26277.1 sodium:solute symporter [Phycisphaerales bacterium]
MNMDILDWGIVVACFVFMVSVALGTKRFMLSVADFLTANRCAGRYLLSVSEGMAAMGVVSFVATWEMVTEAGLTTTWWRMMVIPVFMVIATTGYVIYRFRETRAMTLGQYFEMRYSKSFRRFAGILCFISGILNFGIFPLVGSKVFVYFCGMPEYFQVYGVTIPSFSIIMLFLIIVSLYFALSGGQITIITTDYVQGLFVNIVMILIIFFIVINFNWTQVTEVLQASPPGESLIDPFDTKKHGNFDFWYFAIMVIGIFYSYTAWQGSGQYNTSAKNPHEAKMAKVLAPWRQIPQDAVNILIPIAALIALRHVDFSEISVQINNVLGKIGDENTRNQMLVPTILGKLLPTGLKGALCAVLLAACVSNYDTYMHSWGSIFLQDIVMPLRRKPFKPGEHIRYLRLSIVGVAIFVFIFSLIYPMSMPIYMYWAMTGVIFLGGAGPAIIGGLYWKKGTTAGAFSAMIVGTSIGLGGFVLSNTSLWENLFGNKFPVNGQYLYAISMFCSATLYIVVSLIQNKTFNLERMLHRGEYAIKSDHEKNFSPEKSSKKGVFNLIVSRLGMTSEFSFGDKIIFYSSIFWSILWFVIFVAGCIIAKIRGSSAQAWLNYWETYLKIYVAIAFLVTIWFAIGGISNLFSMLKRLSTMKRDHEDDGTVAHFKDDKCEEIKQSEVCQKEIKI